MQGLIEYASTKIEIKKSVFLAELFPVQSQEQARVLLKEQKTRYFDASHVVHAFILGAQAQILGCSDDGEPSGTAGTPILTVLKGASISDCLLTVTRWFGGKLLGTGGLVKAYTDSAKAVIQVAKTAPLIEVRDFSLYCPYDLHPSLQRSFASLNCSIISEAFLELIHIKGFVPESQSQALVEQITTLSKARVLVTLAPHTRMGLQT